MEITAALLAQEAAVILISILSCHPILSHFVFALLSSQKKRDNIETTTREQPAFPQCPTDSQY